MWLYWQFIEQCSHLDRLEFKSDLFRTFQQVINSSVFPIHRWQMRICRGLNRSADISCSFPHWWAQFSGSIGFVNDPLSLEARSHQSLTANYGRQWGPHPWTSASSRISNGTVGGTMMLPEFHGLIRFKVWMFAVTVLREPWGWPTLWLYDWIMKYSLEFQVPFQPTISKTKVDKRNRIN